MDFTNKLTNTPDLNILNYLYYYNGAGVAASDFNNDGLMDLYFTANQSSDKLYLNQGDFQFIDITDKAGISNAENWTTGVTVVDINNDGWMDIYVCRVGNLSEIKSHNLLYINQGPNSEGIPRFVEESEKYKLNIHSYATQATFFDYDLDGDLDMYLLNHSLYPNRNYGSGKKRYEIDSLAGDMLLRNDNGIFIDVSQESGIHQGGIGYGLGVSISDLNNDGYPDIYIGNDFFENDYLYTNQKDGTFKEVIANNETKFGHTTHFSMGNDIADINNDGYTDIVSADMLPQDLKSYKTSGTEYNYQIYSSYLKNGYAPQFMQNTLHINNGGQYFHETAFLSGIASTEWSWAPLLADLNNDGFKDVFISNGIIGATNDMDFISFIANEHIQSRLKKGMGPQDMAFIDKIPTKHIPNYLFQNNGDNSFTDMTEEWFSKIPSYSNGSVYVDLDNDGDLDLVVNNVNEPAMIIKNNTDQMLPDHHYLKIKFKGSEQNRFAIGAKATVYTGDKSISSENYTSRGFMSAVTPELHFGIGKSTTIDSVHIIWPDRRFEKIYHQPIDTTLVVDYKKALSKYENIRPNEISGLLKNRKSPVDFLHKDHTSIEFNRDPLIPFANTNQGPKTTVADVNNDGLEDFFIGGAKAQASELFLQQADGTFQSTQKDLFDKDAISEDVDNLFFDADADGDQDLIVVSAGNEFITGEPLSPRLYINLDGKMVRDSIAFKDVFIHASTVTAVDIDNDGDLDLCITSNGIPREFGKTPKQYIFQNNGQGVFEDITETYAPEFQNIGLVQDLKWIDLNNDTYMDAVVAGHWMPISIFINDGKSLKPLNSNLSKTNGWWNSLEVGDFDKDGDMDIIAGNWGLNTRLKASETQPITLYRNDFDDNGQEEPVITYFYQDTETTFSSKSELVKQIPMLNKKFLSYSDFANAGFDELFDKEKIENAYKKQTFVLASVYFENDGFNNFSPHPLPFMAQTSSVFDIKKDDFDQDGFADLLLVGNNYEISTQLGRLDALHGLILRNDQKGFFEVIHEQNFDIPGPARNINTIRIQDTVNYMITINNNKTVFLKKSR
jgi:hypothetical protein